MDLLAAARAEVINRHAFFVGWFTGKLPDSAMEASARAFAPDMLMVVPDGQMITAEKVVAMLQGARAKREPDFAIRVDVLEARLLGDAALIDAPMFVKEWLLRRWAHKVRDRFRGRYSVSSTE
jgi:hypothetical protein